MPCVSGIIGVACSVVKVHSTIAFGVMLSMYAVLLTCSPVWQIPCAAFTVIVNFVIVKLPSMIAMGGFVVRPNSWLAAE